MEILNCFCGAKASVKYEYIWCEGDEEGYIVRCDENPNHTLTRNCMTQNRAVCRWNNRRSGVFRKRK